MQITSSAFGYNRLIPNEYTCVGADVNPPLSFSDIPSEAVSLALIVDDPDATNGDWAHWLVWNINPRTTSIGENSVPDGATQGQTDFGRSNWGGPCPVSGEHRYFFRLYALDIMLDLPASTQKDEIRQNIESHKIDEVELIGLFSK